MGPPLVVLTGLNPKNVDYSILNIIIGVNMPDYIAGERDSTI
jgi:hypothetical protein